MTSSRINNTEVNWIAIQLAQTDQFYGISDNNGVKWNSTFRNIVLLTVASCIVGGGLSVILGICLTKPLYRLSRELEKVARLELDLNDLSNTSFWEARQLHQSFRMMHAALSSFRKFVPVAVVNHILKTNKEAVVSLTPGVATVMFQDIRNFTTMSESVDPTILAAIIGEYMESMSSAIAKHGGIIDKYIGDCIMSLFNVPTPIADHESAAASAALECLEVLRKKNKMWKKTYCIEIEQRIGIHSGDLLVGNMGSNHRMSFTVIGDNVNIAARMEGANKPFGTSLLVTKEVHSKLNPNNFASRKISTIRVSGKTIATPVYEVSGNITSPNRNLFSVYESALEKFEEKDFETAEQLIEGLLVIHPSDTPSKRLLERIQEAKGMDPLEEWNYIEDLVK